ncbi:hypothetical protein L0663_08655 [Dyadobacter sp. CY107]|uniref:hypothetical protein n=1 Tax=Dyadobacter fanqingshengii TaxID=2906443 RepID=UPI001F1DF4FA|nr:hypothetical protein [Dyadobacter fanqingshengii]MCF2503442.1 hypothetical protein [Dyadobacter fanqingshengii]
MKLFRNAPTITKALVIVGLLGACQNEKDAVLSPIAEQATAASNQNAKIAANSKLISDGSRKLLYSGPRNLVTKETLESYNYYIEYAYSDQYIKSTRYEFSTNKKIADNTYTLNANGLCIESSVGNNFNGTTKYEYNENQQLIKAFNKFEPNERQEFEYSLEPNGQARLLSVAFYNKAGDKLRNWLIAMSARPRIFIH